MALDRKWVYVALMAGMAVGLAVLAAPSRSEQSDAGGVRAAGQQRFTVVAEPLGDRRLGALVIDAETMRLLVYAFDFNKMQLKLAAVRDISRDVELTHWNNARPWPEDIRGMIESGQAGGDARPDAAPE